MPNPNTIPWLHYQDIQIPDVQLRKQFNNHMSNGNFSQALQLLNDNKSQLQGKAYVADTINKIVDGILKLENYYTDGVTIFMSELAQKYFTLVNDLKLKRAWNQNAQYSQYNFVYYNDDLYFALDNPPTGNLPTDNQHWLRLGLKGETGDTGFDVTMKFNWNANSNYEINDLVVYDGKIWVARQNNSNVTPGTDNNIWIIFVEIVKAQIYVSNVAPNNVGNNAVWFEVNVDPMTYNSNNPLIGQFKRYIEYQDTWEEMYPNTIFSWVVGSDQFAPIRFVDNVTIKPSDWDGQMQWVYYNPNIDIVDDSIVFILPTIPMDEIQEKLYSDLTLDLTSDIIRLGLKSKKLPTSDLSIRIIIQ